VTPGTASSCKIIDIVMGWFLLTYVNNFFDQYLDHIAKLLIHIYRRMSTIDQVLQGIPENFEPSTVELFTTRRPFLTTV
jgi:hypothetical protein